MSPTDDTSDKPKTTATDDTNKTKAAAAKNTAPGSRQEKSPPSRPASKKSMPVLVPLLILCLLAAVVAAVWLYRNLEANREQQQQALSSLRNQSDTAQQQTATHIAQLEQRLQQQQQSQTELRDNLSTLLKRNDHLRKDWLLGEAEYLIKLASYRLQLEGDVPTALRALQAADERLREVGDPALLSVRKVLAADQNALKNVPSADISGMSLTLSALIGTIDTLPLNTPTAATRQEPAMAEDDAEKISTWLELPAAIWQDIKGLLTVRRHDANIAALLSPKEHFYLLQNLHLQLEQARLALLLGKGDVFGERLQAAQTWLTRFFDPKDARVQAAQQTLAQLLTVTIEPEIPGVEKSYQALRAYVAGVPAETQRQPATAPAKAPATEAAPDGNSDSPADTPASREAPL
ncbi:MAG: uroporphyrinogen-III C-methyltransferase [Gammaproteobacteria bacterium]